jgi:hypothetical protein
VPYGWLRPTRRVSRGRPTAGPVRGPGVGFVPATMEPEAQAGTAAPHRSRRRSSFPRPRHRRPTDGIDDLGQGLRGLLEDRSDGLGHHGDGILEIRLEIARLGGTAERARSIGAAKSAAPTTRDPHRRRGLDPTDMTQADTFSPSSDRTSEWFTRSHPLREEDGAIPTNQPGSSPVNPPTGLDHPPSPRPFEQTRRSTRLESAQVPRHWRTAIRREGWCFSSRKGSSSSST